MRFRQDLLRAKKAALNLTNSGLSEKTGLSQEYIGSLLMKSDANPTLSTLETLCEALDLKLSEVIQDEATA